MKAKSFPHGIHPPEGKEPTAEKKLESMSPPEKVVIPLHQHFGNPAAPMVKKGDEVFIGQKIGEAATLFSANPTKFVKKSKRRVSSGWEEPHSPHPLRSLLPRISR
jgi:hypothetical protein